MPKQNVLGNMRRKQVTTEEDLSMDLFWKGIGRRGGGGYEIRFASLLIIKSVGIRWTIRAIRRNENL